MSYKNEIVTNQIYLIEGNKYKIIDIRATNVISQKDYIISVTFKPVNKGVVFTEQVGTIINNSDFELIEI